jgi:hypothetical protein
MDCFYLSQEIIGNKGADGGAENSDGISFKRFENGCGQGVPADQREYCLWQIVERIAVTRLEELVGGDDFNALYYIFGEEWTTTKVQGRGSFPNCRIGGGTLLGYLFISETQLNFDQLIVVRVGQRFLQRISAFMTFNARGLLAAFDRCGNDFTLSVAVSRWRSRFNK